MVSAQLHHYAINAPAEVLEQVISFYAELLDWQPGFRPDFGFNGHWLYAGDHPILHLLEDPNRQPGATAYLDHIALRCEGLDEVRARLTSMGVEIMELDIAELGQVQLFVKDPAGTTVELNFCEN